MYDYIWKNHGIESRVSSCDLQQQNEISVSALGPGDITSHVSIYTVYPGGFQELYRHFLRLPNGAIVEVRGYENILIWVLCMYVCGCVFILDFKGFKITLQVYCIINVSNTIIALKIYFSVFQRNEGTM